MAVGRYFEFFKIQDGRRQKVNFTTKLALEAGYNVECFGHFVMYVAAFIDGSANTALNKANYN